MILPALMAAAALAAAPAMPARGSADYDVECMLSAQSAAGRVDAASRERIGLMMMFFFGRVDSAMSGNVAKERMRNIGNRLVGIQLGPVLENCSQFMSQRGQAMDTLRHQIAPPAKPTK